ncbi:ABC transporter ATP-binding protein [Croceibacterium sp. TMG7-5b_MA50]|uniref:ABC transporter ATP-binding protein n=1 Tax=Croceibacterium sp. TMG7-5b_MA50 TaxID=3121290 RepID=UPI0032215D47
MQGRISASGVGKRFRARHEDAPRTAKEWLLRLGSHKRSTDHFWALRDLSIEVPAGEMLGVVGHNGAGKSTLLRLLGGVMQPDEGQLLTGGRVGGMLALNSGMHEDLSGRDNILINGVIAGLSRTEIRERLDEIISFAELEQFIDNPVRTYSSGMKLRLGFATAAHVQPDILLIDEVLSVGDVAFQQKCLDRIQSFRARGCTIVLISHDLGQVEKLCDRVLWLSGGHVAALGAAATVVPDYRVTMMNRTRVMTRDDFPTVISTDGVTLEPMKNRFGSFEARISGVRVSGPNGDGSKIFSPDQPIVIDIDIDGAGLQKRGIVAVAFGNDERGNPLDLNTWGEGIDLPELGQLRSVRLTIDRLDLAPGDYFLTIGLYEAGWAYAYDYQWRVSHITISNGVATTGPLSPPRRWDVQYQVRDAATGSVAT